MIPGTCHCAALHQSGTRPSPNKPFVLVRRRFDGATGLISRDTLRTTHTGTEGVEGVSDLGMDYGNPTGEYYDTNGDGVADVAHLDTDGDHFIDVYAYDTNFDGHFDTVVQDTFENGKGERWLYDTNGDNVIDTVIEDQNENGVDDRYDPGFPQRNPGAGVWGI